LDLPELVRGLVEKGGDEPGFPDFSYLERVMESHGGRGWGRSKSVVHRAVWLGDHDSLNKALQNGASANQVDSKRVHPLVLAAYCDDDAAIRTLFSHGGDRRYLYGDPLEEAVKCQGDRAFRTLLDAGVQSQWPEGVVRAAILLRRLDYLRLLIESQNVSVGCVLEAMSHCSPVPFPLVRQTALCIKSVLSDDFLGFVVVRNLRAISKLGLRALATFLDLSDASAVLAAGNGESFEHYSEDIRAASQLAMEPVKHLEAKLRDVQQRLVALGREADKLRSQPERHGEELNNLQEKIGKAKAERRNLVDFLYWDREGNPRY